MKRNTGNQHNSRKSTLAEYLRLARAALRSGLPCRVRVLLAQSYLVLHRAAYEREGERGRGWFAQVQALEKRVASLDEQLGRALEEVNALGYDSLEQYAQIQARKNEAERAAPQ